MNKKLKIFIFCMIIVGGGAHSQVTTAKQGTFFPLITTVLRPSFPPDFKRPINILKEKSCFVPGDFYSLQLGFFCKQEIKMDKVLKIPFRFRLGSVEQCDWLEGKRR